MFHSSLYKVQHVEVQPVVPKCTLRIALFLLNLCFAGLNCILHHIVWKLVHTASKHRFTRANSNTSEEAIPQFTLSNCSCYSHNLRTCPLDRFWIWQARNRIIRTNINNRTSYTTPARKDQPLVFTICTSFCETATMLENLWLINQLTIKNATQNNEQVHQQIQATPKVGTTRSTPSLLFFNTKFHSCFHVTSTLNSSIEIFTTEFLRKVSGNAQVWTTSRCQIRLQNMPQMFTSHDFRFDWHNYSCSHTKLQLPVKLHHRLLLKQPNVKGLADNVCSTTFHNYLDHRSAVLHLNLRSSRPAIPEFARRRVPSFGLRNGRKYIPWRRRAVRPRSAQCRLLRLYSRSRSRSRSLSRSRSYSRWRSRSRSLSRSRSRSRLSRYSLSRLRDERWRRSFRSRSRSRSRSRDLDRDLPPLQADKDCSLLNNFSSNNHFKAKFFPWSFDFT